MRKSTGLLLGLACGFAICAVAGLLLLRSQRGFSAREEPSRIEAWVARRARSLATPQDAKDLKNPVLKTPEVIAEGMAHWADHCAVCHANNGDGQTAMGKGMYPPAPDMRQPGTQQLSDGELFYIIENGIRLTGMPAWGGEAHGSSHTSGEAAHRNEASWKLVHFIRHLPELTFAEKREMEHLNPKGPDEFEEEKRNEEFLTGDDNHDNLQNTH